MQNWDHMQHQKKVMKQSRENGQKIFWAQFVHFGPRHCFLRKSGFVTFLHSSPATLCAKSEMSYDGK